METITNAEMDLKAQYMRQLDIFDPTIHDCPVTMIGAGGIGSLTALQIAKLGMKELRIVDFDEVEQHNQPNQLFGLSHLKQNKAVALASIVKQLADLDVETITEKITEKTVSPIFNGIVIAGVDSMASRKAIWSKVKFNPAVRLYIDGRMGGEVLSVYSVNPLSTTAVEDYEATMFDDGEAAELPCTARAIIDVGFMIGALITRAIRKFLVENKVQFEIIFDTKNLMLIKGE
jgi:sulfur carrier protein ThiS adenylyltransferase